MAAIEPTTELLGDEAGAPSPTRFRLLVRNSEPVRSLLLQQGSYLVGKDPACDLVLDDPAVSRQHLLVEVLGNGVRLRDLASTNGSFLHDVRFESVEVQSGAVVRLGKSEVMVIADDAAGATANPTTSVNPNPNPNPSVVAASELAPSTETKFGELLGQSLVMRRLFALLERVARAEASVLVQGETGTGKELCAEALHAHSSRAAKPLVVTDLGAIQPNLIESELFGHVRGAFTGALADRAGAFERADGGTLFLDEIGELSAELQPRLLRALERGHVKRVGANDYRTVNVRVLAATNRDLLERVREGHFREDLYHRLAVLSVKLPPLRERREDIPMLVEHLLQKLGRPNAIGVATLSVLSGHDWPGNVRELRNVIERAVSLAPDAGEVPAELLALPRSDEATTQAKTSEQLPFKEAKERLIEAFEREYLEGLLAKCGNNVSKAAREAGIDRVYLHRLLKRYSLER